MGSSSGGVRTFFAAFACAAVLCVAAYVLLSLFGLGPRGERVVERGRPEVPEPTEPKAEQAQDPWLAELRSRVDAMGDQIRRVQEELDELRRPSPVKAEEAAPEWPVARPERQESPARPKELRLKGDLFYYTAEQLLEEIGMSGKVSWEVQSQIADLLEFYKQERTRIRAMLDERVGRVVDAMYARGEYLDDETYQKMLNQWPPNPKVQCTTVIRQFGGKNHIFLVRYEDYPEIDKLFGDFVGLRPDVLDEIGRILAESDGGS